ncbi:hypothetical protein CFOL_v3_19858 [Cephalotus follicularis]|uniref:Uncharacterized protein n=1 Tax=Cephalotus follicularis TaxID=3775 RepID=A0A1Q3C8J7_CEPFO|nr:hypothetical protein CFOL_v3_19858 [Cephalotus follicularis]
MWCCILEARTIVVRNYQWRIGDECSVKIWKNNWISKGNSCLIHQAPNHLSKDAFVSELIDHVNGGWDAVTVHQNFDPSTTSDILEITLG